MDAMEPRSIRAKRHVVVLDCPDPEVLGAFYAHLLGWRTRIVPEFSNWVSVTPSEGDPAGFEIACQGITDYRMPDWPTGEIPQQGHLDFYVESLAEGDEIAREAGAIRHPVQPSESGSFIVYLDPAGHPFCLCQA